MATVASCGKIYRRYKIYYFDVLVVNARIYLGAHLNWHIGLRRAQGIIGIVRLRKNFSKLSS